MFNMDQTPFLFEFLTGCTYDFKGNKTVWERALRACWGKRQATLQLTICADGEKRCKPLMIFRGKGNHQGKATCAHAQCMARVSATPYSPMFSCVQSRPAAPNCAHTLRPIRRCAFTNSRSFAWVRPVR